MKTLISLPTELLLHVCRYLSLYDCIHLRQIRSPPGNLFQELFIDRISLHLFFGTLLSDANGLLKVLAATDAALVQQKSLSFLFPAHARKHSPWTFVVPACPRRRELFMTFMAKAGVTWETGWDIFARRVQERRSFSMRKNVFLRATAHAQDEEMQAIRRGIINAAFPFVLVRREEGWTFHGSESDEMDLSGDMRWMVLHGRLTSGGTTHSIEMMYDKQHRFGPREYVLQLPSSIEQCFLGGFGAVHLYGRSTSLDRTEVQQADHVGRRSTLDQESLLVETKNDIFWPNEHWECARRVMYFEWKDNGRTKEVETVMKHQFYADEMYALFRANLLPAQVNHDYLLEHGIDVLSD